MPTLKDLRERALLSQSELAKLCHVQKQAVWHWENGVSRPSSEHQRMLVQIYQITPDELLTALRETRALRKERDKPQEDEKERPAA